MNKITFPLLACLLITLLNGCSLTCTEGVGEVSRQEIDLDLFTRIDIDSAIDVELSYGKNQSVVFEGHENHLALLERKVSSKTWEIDFSENVCTDAVKIYITLPMLEGVSLTGSGSVVGKTPFTSEEFDLEISGSGSADMDISAEDVQVQISGSGNIALRGYSDTFAAELSGSGSLNAEEFESKECTIALSGSGDAEVFASEVLEGEITGSGSIVYHGDPEQVISDITGSGTVEKD